MTENCNTCGRVKCTYRGNRKKCARWESMSPALSPRKPENPECKSFIDLAQNGYINTCKGYEPWSCERTQEEGKCRKQKK